MHGTIFLLDKPIARAKVPQLTHNGCTQERIAALAGTSPRWPACELVEGAWRRVRHQREKGRACERRHWPLESAREAAEPEWTRTTAEELTVCLIDAVREGRLRPRAALRGSAGLDPARLVRESSSPGVTRTALYASGPKWRQRGRGRDSDRAPLDCRDPPRGVPRSRGCTGGGRRSNQGLSARSETLFTPYLALASRACSPGSSSRGTSRSKFNSSLE